MIVKEQALRIVTAYIKERNRSYISIAPVDKIFFKENAKVIYPYSKYYEKERDLYVVYYEDEGYTEPITYFVYVDAETGEVLFTMTPHGYAEDWEDELIDE